MFEILATVLMLIYIFVMIGDYKKIFHFKRAIYYFIIMGLAIIIILIETFALAHSFVGLMCGIGLGMNITTYLNYRTNKKCKDDCKRRNKKHES